jgi:hypothetical protein
MADAGELIRDALYAFYNISHSDSPDNRRNTARAKSISRKIIRKFPGSIEADQAQQILERLDPAAATHSLQKQPQHRLDQADRHEQVDQHFRATAKQRPANRDWKKLLQAVTLLNAFERNLLLAGGLLLVIMLPFLAFAIIGASIFLAGPFKKYRPQESEDLLDKFFSQLDAWIIKRR